MPDYSKGKIYRLVCNITGKQYIGSTTNTFPQRLYGHKSEYNKWKEGGRHYYSSFQIVENGNFEMVLIENYPCADKHELESRERYWIETLECVNMFIPTRTREECVKQYYQDHKAEIAEQKKDYRKRSVSVSCECGSSYKQYDVSKHLRTQKHQAYEAQKSA